VQEVGQCRRCLIEPFARAAQLLLELADALLEPAPLGVVRLALCVVELAFARLLVLVALSIGVVQLGLERARVAIRRDGCVDVRVRPPLADALGDLVASRFQTAGIEHARREAQGSRPLNHRPA
jgi:hypothetical protein